MNFDIEIIRHSLIMKTCRDVEYLVKLAEKASQESRVEINMAIKTLRDVVRILEKIR